MIHTLIDWYRLIARAIFVSPKWRLSNAALTICALSIFAIAAQAGAAPIHRSASPIKDSSGRVEVIVDFDFDPDTDVEFDDKITDGQYKRWSGHRTKAIKFLDSFEKRYGIERSGMTSWTTTSMTAFVTSEQLDAIIRDKRVTLATENEFQKYSSFFVASDSIVPGSTGQSSSWGWSLTTSTTPLSILRGYEVGTGLRSCAGRRVRRTNGSCARLSSCRRQVSARFIPISPTR